MHLILGALIGTWWWGKRLRLHAPLIGAAISLVPDGIPLIASFFNFRWQVAVERGPGHSLIFVGLIVWASRRWLAPELRRRFKLSPNDCALGVLWLLLGRVSLDLLDVGGAALIWPISKTRYSVRLIDSPDYVLAAIFLIIWGLMLAQRRRKKPSPRLKKWTWITGSLALAYLALAGGMKGWMHHEIERNLATNHLESQAVMIAPTSLNPFFWRIVVRQPSGFLLGYRSVFDAPESQFRWAFIPRQSEVIEQLEPAWEVRAATDLARGWWIARPHGKGAWIGDLSRGERRDWSVRKHMVHLQCKRAWFYDRESPSSRLLPVTPRGAPPAEVFRRSLKRVAGDLDQWNAFSRLAAVPGQLSEDLAEVREIDEID